MTIDLPPATRPPSNDGSTSASPKAETKKGILQTLGPGLVTGASDDDPSGIATYSQVGAQYGYGMLWSMLFSYPLMCCIQEIAAQIGRVTGRGIAGNLRRYYSPWITYSVIALVLVANTINIGADLEAMGAASALLAGGGALQFATMFAIASFVLQSITSYEKYSRILKWLCTALFAYVATVMVVHVPWAAALHSTVVPHIEFSAGYLTSIVAVLGTTISPYLFFWQAGEEAEDQKAAPGEEPLKQAPRQAPAHLERIRTDTYIGMAFSNLVGFFIIITAAAVLHSHGVTDLQTADQAARALAPLAGKFAFLLFTLGIVGTGLLTVPVLGGSAAYAVGEALRWPVGLAREPLQAKGFYGVLAVATFVGLGLNYMHVSPIKALFWSAVINGVAAGPIMMLMMLMASNRKVVGQFTLRKGPRVVGWIATVVMLATAVGMFATWGK